LAFPQRCCSKLEFVRDALLIARGRGLSPHRTCATHDGSETQQECDDKDRAIFRTHRGRSLSQASRRRNRSPVGALGAYRRFHHPVAAKILPTAAGEFRRFETSAASWPSCSAQARWRSGSDRGLPLPIGKSL